MSCVNVAVYWGAIPADAVQQVQVSFRYPGIDLPSATADVLLRLDAPEGSWFTYTGDQMSREYEYDVTFFMADGQKVTVPTQRSSTQRLIINAPFEDKLGATFVPQGAFPPVASIVVTTKYVDGDYDASDVHSFTSAAESWEWSIDLRDRAKRDFQYRVDVTYADGSSESGDWLHGAEGTILVGDVAREMLEIEVVPDLVDMTKWKLVIVRLEYADAGNKLDSRPHAQADWRAARLPRSCAGRCRSRMPRNGHSRYRIQAFGHDGSKHVPDPVETTDPLVLLEF